MNNLLVLMLIFISIGVIYWVLFGQWKYNKQLRGEK